MRRLDVARAAVCEQLSLITKSFRRRETAMAELCLRKEQAAVETQARLKHRL